jgi:hypothetical protein
MAERFYENGRRTELPVQDIEYNGNIHKSFTEIQWAYIFQQLGIQYLYEPRLYEFIDGSKYKPDFYLPDFDFFIETKCGNLDMKAVHKASNLSRHTGKVVYIFDGIQTNKQAQDQSESAVRIDQNTIRFKYRWCECPTCHQLSIEHLGDERLIKCPCPGKLDRDMRTMPNQERFHMAYQNALHKIKFKNADGKKFAVTPDLNGRDR